MNSIKPLWLALLCLFGLNISVCLAQSSLAIRIVDEKSNPLSAHIHGFDQAEKPVFTKVSDSQGILYLPTSSDWQRIEITHVGFIKKKLLER